MKHKVKPPYVIIIILVVIVAAIMIFTTRQSKTEVVISKQDYQLAQTDIGTLSTSYNAFLIDSRVDISSSGATKNVAEKLRRATDDFDSAYQQLGTNKAVLNDKKLAGLYKDLESKKPKLDEMSVALQEEYTTIIPVLQSIKKHSSATSNQKLEEFAKNEFSKSGELKSDINKTFVGDITGVNKYSGRQLSYSEALKRWSVGVEKLNKDADVSKIIEELSNETARKIRSLE